MLLFKGNPPMRVSWEDSTCSLGLSVLPAPETVHREDSLWRWFPESQPPLCHRLWEDVPDWPPAKPTGHPCLFPLPPGLCIAHTGSVHSTVSRCTGDPGAGTPPPALTEPEF